MRQAVLLVGLIVGAGAPALAQESTFPTDIQQLSCSDWKKVAPHVWTQTHPIVENGKSYEGNTLDNTDQSRMLDLLCTS